MISLEDMSACSSGGMASAASRRSDSDDGATTAVTLASTPARHSWRIDASV